MMFVANSTNGYHFFSCCTKLLLPCHQKQTIMKKMIFFILLAFITTTSFAQIYQGQWMVGGNLSLQESKYGDVSGTKITQFNTSPDIGYFFINNFAGGLRFTFNSA